MLSPASLEKAMSGVRVAYYLIHSMGAGADFEQRDLVAARNFGTAAKAAGVERIIYLGGLADSSSELSDHLRSRQQTGEALREAQVKLMDDANTSHPYYWAAFAIVGDAERPLLQK